MEKYESIFELLLFIQLFHLSIVASLTNNCVQTYFSNQMEIEAVLAVPPANQAILEANSTYPVTTLKSSFITLDFNDTVKRWDWNVQNGGYFNQVTQQTKYQVNWNTMLYILGSIIVAGYNNFAIKVYNPFTLIEESNSSISNLGIQQLSLSNVIEQSMFAVGGRSTTPADPAIQGTVQLFELNITSSLTKQVTLLANITLHANVTALFYMSDLKVLIVGAIGELSIYRIDIDSKSINANMLLFSDPNYSNVAILSANYFHSKEYFIIGDANGVITFNTAVLTYDDNDNTILKQVALSKIQQINNQAPVYKMEMLNGNFSQLAKLITSCVNAINVFDLVTFALGKSVVMTVQEEVPIFSFAVIEDMVITVGNATLIGQVSISLQCGDCEDSLDPAIQACQCDANYTDRTLSANQPLDLVNATGATLEVYTPAVCQLQRCPKYCQNCDKVVSSICDACLDSYYLNATNNTCLSCSTMNAGCALCNYSNSSFSCQKCIDFTYLRGDTNLCSVTCESGKVQVNAQSLIQNIEDNGNQCLDACPDLLKADQNNNCYKCHSSCIPGACLLPNNINSCFECQSPDEYLDPPVSLMQIPSTEKLFGKCISLLQKCSGADTAVFVTKALSESNINRCELACPAGSFDNGTAFCKVCQDLMPGCVSCIASSTCTMCNNNNTANTTLQQIYYYLQLNKLSCQTFCDIGSMGVNTLLNGLHCVPGSVCLAPLHLDLTTRICSKCHDSCADTMCIYANDANYCTQCFNPIGNYLEIQSYQNAYGTCLPCPIDCTTCSQTYNANRTASTIICQGCHNQKFLSSDSSQCISDCVLEIGSFAQMFATKNKQCLQCQDFIPRCSQCNNETTCLACFLPYFFNSGRTSIQMICGLQCDEETWIYNLKSNQNICSSALCPILFVVNAQRICSLCSDFCQPGQCVQSENINACIKCRDSNNALNYLFESASSGQCILLSDDCTLLSIKGRPGVKYYQNMSGNYQCQPACPGGMALKYGDLNRICTQKVCNTTTAGLWLRFDQETTDPTCKPCNDPSYYVDEEYEACLPKTSLLSELKLNIQKINNQQLLAQIEDLKMLDFAIAQIVPSSNPTEAEQIAIVSQLKHTIVSDFLIKQEQHFMQAAVNESNIVTTSQVALPNFVFTFTTYKLAAVKSSILASSGGYELPLSFIQALRDQGIQQILVSQSLYTKNLTNTSHAQFPFITSKIMRLDILDVVTQKNISVANNNADWRIKLIWLTPDDSSLQQRQRHFLTENNQNNVTVSGDSKCHYFDEQKGMWSMAGVETDVDAKGQVVSCLTNAFSQFALLSLGPDNGLNDTKTWVYLVIIIPISSVVLIISIFVGCKLNNKNAKKTRIKQNSAKQNNIIEANQIRAIMNSPLSKADNPENISVTDEGEKEKRVQINITKSIAQSDTSKTKQELTEKKSLTQQFSMD